MPFEPVVYAKNADVQTAAKAGVVDMVFTNATPARMNDLYFSPVVLQVEQGYLVPAASAVRTLDDVDRDGMRVGVSEGSTSEVTLSRTLRHAKVVSTASLKADEPGLCEFAARHGVLLRAFTLEALATAGPLPTPSETARLMHQILAH